MKKVVQTLYSGTGGHATVVFNLLENGGLKYWDNHLFFYGIEPLEKGHEEFCKKNNVSYDSSIKKLKFDWKGYIKIFRFFLKVKPDVLIIHNHSIFIAALLYTFLYRPRLITVDHMANIHKRKSAFIFLKIMTFFSDNVIVLNSQQYKELTDRDKFYTKHKDKFSVIPNGITYLKSEKRNYVQGRIGMIARFSMQKDQKSLIRAFALVLKKRKDTHLFLVGDGDTFLECNELVKHLKIENSVTFTGNLKYDEAQKLCATFQFFVMSTFGETVGMTVLEAFSKRVPVIASEVEGIVDYMVDEENGFLVPAANPEKLAEKIIELMEKEPSYFEPIIENSLRTIDQKFDAQKTFNAYNALL